MMDLSKLTPFHVIRYAICEDVGDDLHSTDVIMEDEIAATTLDELVDKLAEVVSRVVLTWGDVSDTLKDEEWAKTVLARPLGSEDRDTFSIKVAKHPSESHEFIEITGYTIEMRHGDGSKVRAPFDDYDSNDRRLFDRVIAARDKAHARARINHADALERRKVEVAERDRASKLAEIARLQAELDAGQS